MPPIPLALGLLQDIVAELEAALTLNRIKFIRPNVLHRACLSIGEDAGFADQFRLRLTVLAQNL